MAKSGSTPIEFSAKAYLIAAILTAALAAFALFSAINYGQPTVLLLTVFWAVICGLCVRSWLAKK
jgi:hypothetical protein